MADEALTLTPEDIDSFMRYRSEQGGTVDSNKAYLRAMRHFYKDLQELGGGSVRRSLARNTCTCCARRGSGGRSGCTC